MDESSALAYSFYSSSTVIFIFGKEHKVMTDKWLLNLFRTKQPLASLQLASSRIPVCSAQMHVYTLVCKPASGIG